MPKRYLIRSQYFFEQWTTLEEGFVGTMEQAWRRASEIARGLDGRYGKQHQWNVMLTNEAGEGIVELFHGRLS